MRRSNRIKTFMVAAVAALFFALGSAGNLTADDWKGTRTWVGGQEVGSATGWVVSVRASIVVTTAEPVYLA